MKKAEPRQNPQKDNRINQTESPKRPHPKAPSSSFPWLDEQGMVFDIQRYSLHDGPGVRTTVFLKGCPLRCLWCDNPESQNMQVEKMGNKTVGKIVAVREVLEVVRRDLVFYHRSGGGMTLSGGEPLMQPDFASALVKGAKKEGMHAAVETSGYQNWDKLWQVIQNVDLVLLDLKVMDQASHKKLTGVDNSLILENAEKLAAAGMKIIFRIPVIPGYNNDRANLFRSAAFAEKIGVREIHLLPYQAYGENKYLQLGRKYELRNLKPPSDAQLEEMSAVLKQNFQKVKIEIV